MTAIAAMVTAKTKTTTVPGRLSTGRLNVSATIKATAKRFRYVTDRYPYWAAFIAVGNHVSSTGDTEITKNARNATLNTTKEINRRNVSNGCLRNNHAANSNSPVFIGVKKIGSADIVEIGNGISRIIALSICG